MSVNAANDTSKLSDHQGHASDLIPAPASGCPSGTGTTSENEKPDNGNQGGSQGNDNPGNTNQNEKISLCHATGSAKHPYVFITVSVNAAGPDAVAGHTHHTDDIIPATSLADCPKTLPEDGAGNRGKSNNDNSNPGNQGGNDNDKIGLCHATGSATNPYVFIVVSVNAAGPDSVAGHRLHADDIIPANSIADCPNQAGGSNNPGQTTDSSNPGNTTGSTNPSNTTGGSTSGNNQGQPTGGTNAATQNGNPPAQAPGSAGSSSPSGQNNSVTAPDSAGPAAGTGSPAQVVTANLPAAQPEAPSAVLGAVQAPAQTSEGQALAPALDAVQPVSVGMIPGLPNTGYGFMANLDIANHDLSSWLVIAVLAGLLSVIVTTGFALRKPSAKSK